MEVELRCLRCKMTIAHVCHTTLLPAIRRLFEWTPTDGLHPFFSEAYLYHLLGKEDGRTALALVRTVIQAAGVEESHWAQYKEQRDVERAEQATANKHTARYVADLLVFRGLIDADKKAAVEATIGSQLAREAALDEEDE